MAQSDWNRSKSLFLELVVLDPPAQQARLTQIESESPELYAELSGLLKSDVVADQTDVLDNLHESLSRVRADTEVPDTFGPYELAKFLATTSDVAHRTDARLLELQGRVAELASASRIALLYAEPSDEPLHFWKDMKDDEDARPEMRPEPRWNLPVSMAAAGIKCAPGVDRAANLDRLKKLNRVLPLVQRVQRDSDLHLLYVGLESGVHYSYPCHYNYNEKFDPRKRPWYRKAKEEGGKTTWSEIYGDASKQGKMISCSRAIYDEAGRLLGVASLDIKPANLLGETSERYVLRRVIVDADGRVLIYAGQGDEGAHWQWVDEPKPFEHAAVRAAIRRSDNGMEPVEHAGRRLLVTWNRLSYQGWYYVVVADEALVLDD